MARRTRLRRAAIAAVLALFALCACTSTHAQRAARDEPNAPVAATTTPAEGGSEPTGAPCGDPGEWSCDWLARFDATDTFALLQPGITGIVVHDRQTGATWSNANADTSMWAASTVKLAMAADLLQRAAAGAIALTDDDRTLIDDMLLSSDDVAADELWYAYAGDDLWTFNNDFVQMGMTDCQPQPYEGGWPYWGYQMCTPEDLNALMNYVLDDLAPSLRDQIVPLMQSVDEDQQWGVWAVGPAGAPGVKDGWTDDLTDLSTVGFVGPDARYTVAIMDHLDGDTDFDAGKELVSQIAAMLFDGAF